jgi:cytochrome o ubiquinol oxidase operon protein cyoD
MTDAASSNRPDAPGADDRAPGEGAAEEGSVRGAVIGYVVGLALATGLTGASFLLPLTHLVYAPALPVALAVMAVAQMGVHLVFFLHITTGPDNTNNVLALAFGVLVVFLIMAGSLWIMANLNHNMAPMTQVMRMQQV